MRKATGNEYKIEPKIIPGSPMISKPKYEEIIPLAPNRLIKPKPWEIDGINIGKVKNTFKIARCSIWVLFKV